MPWQVPRVNGVNADLPQRRRSSTATASCIMNSALFAHSVSSSFLKGSFMSLREGNTVSMISRCCLLPVVTSVVRDAHAQTYEQVMLLTMLIMNCVPPIPTGEFIIGRVIKAMNNSWHPDCFCCDICQAVLADVGFVKNAGRHLCRPCHNREKARGLGKYICQKCHAIIEEQPLIFKNDPYHPDHFNCSNCSKELTADARELKGELYCLPCHDKMGVPICGACRRPIEGRVVNAMGKQWHVEHFVCAKCEKPFLGHRHYERKGLAYCETHYNQLFGDVCYHCNRVIEGDVVSALNKAWCVNCFSCSTCNTKLTLKNKFVEFDMKPVCKKCYEKFPLELKKRLKKLAETVGRK
uniref:LIM and senescent cell antigen-like-containing domain protein 1 n=1 Tax=Sinocyclocheilus grahami TaxID=75366 RepID=A0A672KBN3_SINGR